jgi:hypothetical protein
MFNSCSLKAHGKFDIQVNFSGYKKHAEFCKFIIKIKIIIKLNDEIYKKFSFIILLKETLLYKYKKT